MKRLTLVLCVFVSFVFALCVFAPSQAAAAGEPIKIGAIVSLTGWAGFLGQPIKEALEVSVEDVNSHGGALGRSIEVYFEDDQSNPTNSVVAATKLIRDKKVSALIGPSFTSGCMSIVPICEQEQIPVIFPAPATTGLEKWVFHVLVDDTRSGPGILQFVAETLGKKKIAILTGDEEGFLAGVKAIKEQAPKYGASIIIQEQFKLSDTNMTPQLTKIKAANPEVLIFYGIANPAAVAAKNYVQLGMKVPVVCTAGVGSKDFARLAGPVLKDKPWIVFGLKFLFAEKLPASDPYRKIYDPYVKAIKDKYNKEAQTFGANAADCLHIIVESMKMAKSDDRAAIRDAMEKVRYNGLIGGTFACSATDHYGMAVKDFMPEIIKDGEYMPYKK
jgi:branched-chain amino acid transport system substrate-binding protein